jgi:FkbM family methyltransferase
MKLKTIKTVLNHPLNKKRKLKALLTLFKRGIVIRLHKYPMIYPFVENVSLVVDPGMSSAELQIYTGLYDTNEMLFVMHYLRPEDTFVDVGANIGVYSVLASGITGAKSLSFEPIPSTFANLKRNIHYNNLQDKSELFNLGVGDKQETLIFSNSLDAINHVINDKTFGGPVTEVPVDSLDNLLAAKNINLLKIDVEGFEANVINGALKTLERPELKIIIMETNGLSDQYEFGQNYIHDKLLSLGFLPYNYFPAQRKLTKITDTNPENTIYIRDLSFVENRIKTARKIRLGDELI